MCSVTTPDIETEFIREFSTLDNVNLGKQDRPERQERIRRAIYREGKANEPFRDSGMTYAEAFQALYRSNLDTRRLVRPEPAITDNPDAQ